MSPPSLNIVLSPEAEEDIQDILQYTLQTWGEIQMEEYAAMLTSVLALLATTPHIGRRRDDIYPHCLCHQAESHNIYYDVAHGVLRVARILHVRMNTRIHFT